jgi:hypothetical protein
LTSQAILFPVTPVRMAQMVNIALYSNPDGSTSIQLTFPYSDITGAGFSITDDGVKNYFYASFDDVHLYYRSTDVSVYKTAYLAKLSAEPATISSKRLSDH